MNDRRCKKRARLARCSAGLLALAVMVLASRLSGPDLGTVLGRGWEKE